MKDPTTEQIRLFLQAECRRSALVVALVRGFPWRSVAVALTLVATAYVKITP